MNSLSASDFLRHYLSPEETETSKLYPKANEAKVVFDHWRLIGQSLGLEQTEAFYKELTLLWMGAGRIRWCPQSVYKPAIEAMQKGSAYETLRHFRRLANQGLYIEFPVTFDMQNIASDWQRIIEHTIFQIHLEPVFYQNMAHYWLSYFDRSIKLLRKCVVDQNVDRFASHLFFLSKYGFDMRHIYRIVLDEISFEALDHWESALNYRAKRLRLDPNFDVYSQVILYLLSEFDAEKNIKQTLAEKNERAFLEEYFHLSEAGFAMKFPLNLSHFQKINSVWEEVITRLDRNADTAFIHRVTRLWISLINPIALHHEHWEDRIVFELIEALGKQ